MAVRAPANPGAWGLLDDVPLQDGSGGLQIAAAVRAVLEVAGRVPAPVVRSTFAMLPFDDDGRMDSDHFLTRQWARAESALDCGLDAPDSQDNVLEAATLVVAHGGAWKPSNAMARALDDVALGRTACRRALLHLLSTQGPAGQRP